VFIMTVPISELKSRLSNIRKDMSKEGIDSLLISGKGNIIYLTGGEDGVVVITTEHAILWLKDIYIKHYEELYLHKNYPFEIREYGNDVTNDVIEYLKCLKNRIGVENITINSYEKLLAKIKNKLIISNIVEFRRMIKSDFEIDMLKKSAEIAKKGMCKAYEVIRDGISEAEAAAEIESTIRKHGSETPPFGSGILLASGSSTADIHAKPTQNKIKNNSLVIVDLGARYNHYFSDMTRSIPVGNIGKKERDTFEFIKSLEEETIERLEIGIRAEDIHEFVKNEINKRGYKFYHSTGHGVGLEIHELPNIASESDIHLKDRMVFTIEPGIYIPKRFGVRFEDTVLLRKNKIEIITR